MDFDTVYRETADIVYRYLFSLTQDADTAEELTQQAFYEAIRNAGRYRGESALSTYLCGIAKNLLRKERQRQNRQKTVPLENMESMADPSDTESSAMDKIACEALLHKIRLLPDKTREVVVLRLSGELPFTEIGKILGESETWARVTFYRAKQALMKGEMT